jgi:hypothetical protein
MASLGDPVHHDLGDYDAGHALQRGLGILRRRTKMIESAPSTPAKTRSLSFSRNLTKIFTYALLIFFSLIMLLPLLFLLNGSLQPEWQINANPVIWLPHKWLMAQAGNTNRYLNKYLLKDENGEQIETIQVGLRS